jgi:pantoate--beta-alanine ligase
VRIIQTVAELRATLSLKQNIVLVPTMGNLHEGHLSLVRLARERGDLVVTSIFVNRLQFAPHEDFAKYPRTFERDCELLAGSGNDIVFAPTDAEVYPEPQVYTVQAPPELAGILEGEVRPAFFTGVCTVVLKLFNMVQPTAAVFGKKDYQQLLVIRAMVRQLMLPIEVVSAETVRNSSGLALSSRNGYLNDSQRTHATQLHSALSRLAAMVRSGRSDWQSLEREALEFLRGEGWQPDYVAIRRRGDLGVPPSSAQFSPEHLVVLAAAKLGGTRLIDNIEI